MSTVTVKSSRHYSAHKALLRAADNFLFAAEQNEPFCSDGHFVSLVMSSLAVESLCNTTGELVVQDWKDFESASPRAKIRLICAHLDIAYDKQQEPFISLLWVIKFRNKIAHAKPEPLSEELIASQEEYEALISGDGPQSELEKQISVDAARRALNAIEQFQELIYGKLPEESKHLVASDLWEMSVNERPGS